MFIRAIQTEILKLWGSLALLIVLVVPALIGAVIFLALLTNPKPPSWQGVFEDFAFPIWSFFLLPMAVTAFATLLGNIEHRSGIWEHWLSLPVPRWCYYAAKVSVVILGTWLMTALAVGLVYLSAVFAGSITGQVPLSSIDWAHITSLSVLTGASAVMFAVLQLWAALRFTNFVMPLALGIIGTLIAIAVTMTRTKQADYFPWVLPVRVVTSADPVTPALVGLCGGIVCALLMIIELQRRR